MVYVPAGEFLMGSTEQQEHYDDELPQHKQVIAQPFWLDLTPVTNADYERFVQDGGYRSAAFWTDAGWTWAQQANGSAPKNYNGFTDPQQPRVGVTWFEAYAYCQWRGGRLPTEAEWEWAARGRENRVYPWGNSFKADLVIYDQNSGNKTASVGDGIRAGGASWVGALDMSGNVWEWCHSVSQAYPYKGDDGRESNINNNSRVLRGGSWSYNATNLRSAYRYRNAPSVEYINFGFRCARSS